MLNINTCYMITIFSILFILMANVQDSYSASVLEKFRINNNTNENSSSMTDTFGNLTHSQSSNNNDIKAPNSLSSSPFG